MSEQTETYYQRNREKCLARANEYRTKNKEKYQVYWKTYYMKKKQEILEKRKEYARKNKEYIYQRNRTVYYPKHYAKKKADRPPKVLKEVKEQRKRKNKVKSLPVVEKVEEESLANVEAEVEEQVEEESVEFIQDVSELNPTVHLPQWTMIISPGNHTITWD